MIEFDSTNHLYQPIKSAAFKGGWAPMPPLKRNRNYHACILCICLHLIWLRDDATSGLLGGHSGDSKLCGELVFRRTHTSARLLSTSISARFVFASCTDMHQLTLAFPSSVLVQGRPNPNK